jgi:hypothetical protein
MDRNQARKNIQKMLQGAPPRRTPSLEEAKARLRAADPGIDISRPLKLVNRGETGQAAAGLLAETVTAITLPYIHPVLSSLLTTLLSGRKRLSR